MAEQYIKIANLTLCLHTEEILPESDAFQPFILEAENAEWNISLISVDEMPGVSKKLLYRNEEYAVYRDNEQRMFRCHFDRMDDGKIYAITQTDVSCRQVTIFYLHEKKYYLNEWGNTFFHIGIEKILACEQRFILHASFVRTPFGGILFSGASGIGKSTQAELWCQYTDSTLINGDRPIIGKENCVWTAYGSPYAGSSRCYINENYPIRAIVLLQQADDCNIRRLSVGEAFRRIFAGTTVNVWDAEFVDTICTLESELVSQIPVYELSCTPDKRAVQMLWDVLEGGM